MATKETKAKKAKAPKAPKAAAPEKEAAKPFDAAGAAKRILPLMASALKAEDAVADKLQSLEAIRAAVKAAREAKAAAVKAAREVVSHFKKELGNNAALLAILKDDVKNALLKQGYAPQRVSDMLFAVGFEKRESKPRWQPAEGSAAAVIELVCSFYSELEDQARLLRYCSNKLKA